jgi:cell wall-associated NlpC family hydrolase
VALSYGAAPWLGHQPVTTLTRIESGWLQEVLQGMSSPQPTNHITGRVNKAPGITRAWRRRVVAVVAACVVAASGAAAVAAPVHAGPAAVASPTARVRADVVADLAKSALTALDLYSATGDDGAYITYAAGRDAIARAVAERLEIDAASLVTAWSAADVPHQTALMAAFTQMGVPYRRNTSKPGVSFDCSGLTTYAWKVAGVGLARSSRDQIRTAAARTSSTAQAGDLVYFPGHVMMWLGVGTAIVHSPNPGHYVEVTFISARRAKNAKYGNPIG